MDFNLLIDIFLHTPKYLDTMFSLYSFWAYVILFAILFLETGVVITPFLPGDSILFGIGAIAAASGLINIPLMLILLCFAAILGDSLNYEIGRLLRDKLKRQERIPLVKMKHIKKTQDYFERHGGKTITIARFIPIIRTFAPFVSGTAKMKYSKFLFYNIIGGVSWVCLMFGTGYFFGNLSFVKDNFSLVTIAIILISLVPFIITFIKNRKHSSKQNEG